MADTKFQEDDAAAYLESRGIPELIDELVTGLCSDKPKNVSRYITEHLASRGRSSCKGGRAPVEVEAAFGGRKKMKAKSAFSTFTEDDDEVYDGRTPEHCTRNPRLQPSEYRQRRDRYTIADKTRSTIKAPDRRTAYGATVAAQFQHCKRQCVKRCEEIVRMCERAQKQFWDDEFWYGRQEVMYPKGTPFDCTVAEPIEATRVGEVFPGAPLFRGGTGAQDVIQGQVGDCFFIGAIAALACCTAQDLKPIERLFAYKNPEWGVYGVMWFKNGGWEWVIIDDYIATYTDQQGYTHPMYASPNRTNPELWPVLLEKAYAKLLRCWDSIDGGWVRNAIGEATGGLEYTLDLQGADRRMTWEQFKEIVDDPMTILGCAVGQHIGSAGGMGHAGEQGALYGLFHGHAYSVLRVAEARDGQGFVRIRNPWGGAAEWQGEYSDNAPEWRQNPHHYQDLNPAFKNDGAFWMTWEKFSYYFSDLDVVRFFEDDWLCLSAFGLGANKDDTPQGTWILRVSGQRTRVILSMGQDDPTASSDHAKQKRNELGMLRLAVNKVQIDRPPVVFDELKHFEEQVETVTQRRRVVFLKLDLEPGLYSVVPQYVYMSGVGFYLRVFTPPEGDLALWRFDATETGAQHTSAIPR